jgi:class 3 adenylate cyclase
MWTSTGIAHVMHTPDGTPGFHIVQFSLKHMIDMLQSYQVTPNAVSVLTDNVMDVIATSIKDVDLFVDLGHGQIRYKALNEMNHNVLTDLHTLVQAWHGQIPADGCVGPTANAKTNRTVTQISCDIKIPSGRYFINVVVWKENDLSIPYYVINAIPATDVNAEADLLLRNLLIIGILVSFGCILITISVILIILRPIRTCTSILNHSAHLDQKAIEDKQLASQWMLMTSETQQLLFATKRVQTCIGFIKKFSSNQVTQMILRENIAPRALVLNEIEGGSVSPKDISVMFIDVIDYTRQTSLYGPSCMLNGLYNLFNILDEEAAKDDVGAPIVDKYIGDCAMYVWGAPKKLLGHTLFAVRFALRVHKRINLGRSVLIDVPKHSSASSESIPLRIKIGLSTGSAYAGMFGGDQRMNYTVNGNCVNEAARLEGAANGLGYVIGVSADVHSKTSEEFVYRRVPSTKLKGLENQVTGIYEPLCERDTTEKTKALEVMASQWNETLNEVEQSTDLLQKKTILEQYLCTTPDNLLAQSLLNKVTKEIEDT